MSAAKMDADSTSTGDLSRSKKRKKSEERSHGKKSRKTTKKDKENVVAPTPESTDLDLDVPMFAIGHYIKERVEMIEQLFHCVSGPSLRRALPDVLKDMPLADLKSRCLRQLEVMSRKRIRRILEGDDPTEISSSGTEDESDAEQDVDDKEKKTVDEKGEVVETANPPTQMEILELEMRARAIKAMLKTQNEPSEETKTLSDTTATAVSADKEKTESSTGESASKDSTVTAEQSLKNEKLTGSSIKQDFVKESTVDNGVNVESLSTVPNDGISDKNKDYQESTKDSKIVSVVESKSKETLNETTVTVDDKIKETVNTKNVLAATETGISTSITTKGKNAFIRQQRRSMSRKDGKDSKDKQSDSENDNQATKTKLKKNAILTAEGFKQRTKTYKSLRGRRRDSESYSDHSSSSSESDYSSDSRYSSYSSRSRSRTYSGRSKRYSRSHSRERDNEYDQDQTEQAIGDPIVRQKKMKKVKKVKEKVVKEVVESESSMEEGEIDSDASSYYEVTDDEYEMSYSILEELVDNIDELAETFRKNSKDVTAEDILDVTATSLDHVSNSINLDVESVLSEIVTELDSLVNNEREELKPLEKAIMKYENFSVVKVVSSQSMVKTEIENDSSSVSLVGDTTSLEDVPQQDNIAKDSSSIRNVIMDEGENHVEERKVFIETESESEVESSDEEVTVAAKEELNSDGSDSSFFDEVENRDTSIYVDAVISSGRATPEVTEGISELGVSKPKVEYRFGKTGSSRKITLQINNDHNVTSSDKDDVTSSNRDSVIIDNETNFAYSGSQTINPYETSTESKSQCYESNVKDVVGSNSSSNHESESKNIQNLTQDVGRQIDVTEFQLKNTNDNCNDNSTHVAQSEKLLENNKDELARIDITIDTTTYTKSDISSLESPAEPLAYETAETSVASEYFAPESDLVMKCTQTDESDKLFRPLETCTEVIKYQKESIPPEQQLDASANNEKILEPSQNQESCKVEGVHEEIENYDMVSSDSHQQMHSDDQTFIHDNENQDTVDEKRIREEVGVIELDDNDEFNTDDSDTDV